MSNNNIVKNENRVFRPAPKKYVPQYEQLGVEPAVERSSRNDPDRVFSPRRMAEQSHQNPMTEQLYQKNNYVAQPQPNAQQLTPQPEPPSNNDVEIGDLLIMHSGQIIFIGSEDETREAVWKMVAEDEVDPSTLIVLKRLPINIGVSF